MILPVYLTIEFLYWVRCRLLIRNQKLNTQTGSKVTNAHTFHYSWCVFKRNSVLGAGTGYINRN